MGRHRQIARERQPITWQAAMRLLVSMGLFVLALIFTTALIYQSALTKATHERAEDLRQFYQVRLAQLERDWEIQTRDFKTRIEFTRYLEHRQTALVNLQAFFTIQGGERRFSQLVIQDKAGKTRFRLSREGGIAHGLKADEAAGWYLDTANRKLYRVFQESIWLGNEGAGWMTAYFPLDNSLLYQLATPGVTLAVQYQGETLASSAGSSGIVSGGRKSDLFERKELPWVSDSDNAPVLQIEALVRPLFSAFELSLGIGLIPVLDALILWFALGTWLMLQAKRIRAMGNAVSEFATHYEVTPALEKNIQFAQGGKQDEIRDVSVVIEALARLNVEQRKEREIAEVELKQHRDKLEELVADRTSELEVANRKLIEQSNRLIVSEAELQQAQAVARIGSWSLNMRESKLNWSAETYRIFGVEEGTPVNYELFLSLSHPEDREKVDNSWKAAMCGEKYSIEHRIVRHGEIRWVREQAELVFGGDGRLEAGIGTVQDITEIKQYEHKIEQMAYIDALTSLPNRRMLYDRLHHALAAARRNGMYSALMFIDMDNFKPLNDRYGHVVGDALLIEVARRLLCSVREADTVARYGGDEFVVLLNELDGNRDVAKAEAAITAGKIRSILAQPYKLESGDARMPEVEHHSTPSIGVVIFSGAASGMDEILSRADAAMYQAKSEGRNLVRFFNGGAED